jgi:hypothetical protein
MKKTILIISFVLLSFSGYSQSEKVAHDSTTVETVIVAKTEYKVYQGPKGGKYICRISKSGKFYKQYLKKEEND